MNRKAQLILPGLFDLPLEELEPGFVDDELPHLNRILRLATPRANREYSIDAILRSALALQPTDAGLPLAQAFVGDSSMAGRSLLVEAIHLQADLYNAIAIPIPGNEENIHDISIIINDLSDLFKVDFDVTAVSRGLYLLQLKAFDPPTHYPHLLSVLGKSVNPFIEQSRQVLPWYRLLNEIQMFMHQHPVNAQRLRQGRLAINSLWAWGAGVAPASPPNSSPDRVPGPDWYCDDLVLSRFAGSLGLTVKPCASLAQNEDLDHALIVDLRLLQFLKAGLEGRLDQLLLDIERALVAPVVKTLARRSLPLRLRAGYRVDFELNPGARFKFWRRPANLASWRN
jgi:hypothetical protein